MAEKKNIVGPQIRRLRYERGLTQDMLAARLTVKGIEVSRGTLSKIEAQLRCVTDKELWMISRAMNVSLESLFPPGRR